MKSLNELRNLLSITYTKQCRITFYGWPDNDPKHSAAIAYPGTKGNPPVKHLVAGGNGTWKNPTTLACARGLIKVGARLYIKQFRIYGIIEDTCGGCPRTPTGLDVWINGQGHPDKDVIACENRLTPDGLIPVIFNPPSNLPVRTVPLFDGTCHP